MTHTPHAPTNARLWLSVLATTLGGVLEWALLRKCSEWIHGMNPDW
ncbi:hypothetical protein [Acetobacter malorum]|nr:hypothetical protein [Acetobacter malorum]